MTGTAETEASEFVSTYGLHVVPIPTHKPIARVDQGDLIYKTEDAKFQACIDDIIERNAAGQPVLVGTVSVEKSEKLSRMMEKQGVAHEVLNAKQHHREADIVTQAGRLGAVTVATNMAGRGVDILLGGNPEGLADRDTRAEGLDPDSAEGRPRFEELVAKHKATTDVERKKVLALGGLYVLETGSVMAQVVAFRAFGQRVLRMAPIHHHFELLGWAETTVVVRFWIIAGLGVTVGLGLFYAEWLGRVGVTP